MIQFQTNVMCASCISKVTPILNELLGEKNWEVDTAAPTKILSIYKEDAIPSQIIETLNKIGYKATLINNG